jgi:hypothetical protein
VEADKFSFVCFISFIYSVRSVTACLHTVILAINIKRYYSKLNINFV